MAGPMKTSRWCPGLNRAHPLAAGLVGFWPFWGGGTVQDLGPNGMHGGLAAMETGDWQPGDDGIALDFTGGDDYVNLDAHVAYVASLSAGAIMVRFAHTAGGPSMYLLSASDKSDASSNIGLLYYSTDELRFIVREAGTNRIYYTGMPPCRDGKSHTFIYTTDATGNALYLDGLPASGTYTNGSAATNAFFSHVNDIDVLRFGNNEDSGGQELHYDGRISAAGIWGNRRMTAGATAWLHRDPWAVTRRPLSLASIIGAIPAAAPPAGFARPLVGRSLAHGRGALVA